MCGFDGIDQQAIAPTEVTSFMNGGSFSFGVSAAISGLVLLP
jgi:hypothetical protein